ncbi:MAG TPA: hypothetical protein PLX97_13465 [Gemmatales bacterium]|nr:hypothetical protein [Gemmatales bacterium]
MWWGRKGDWHTHIVAGHEVQYWQPAKPLPFAVLYLPIDHADFESSTQATDHLLQLNWPVIVPQVKQTWWLDRLIPSFDNTLSPAHWLLGPVFDWAATNWNICRLAVVGIGTGGQGALRLGFCAPEKFPVVVSLDGSIALEKEYGKGTCLDHCFLSPEECRQHSVGMMINPRQVPRHLALFANSSNTVHFRGNDRLHEKLRALGVEHHADLQGDCTKTWWGEALQYSIRFMQQGMKAESRRLL